MSFKKKVIYKVFINLKDNENQLLITKTIILIKIYIYLMRTPKKKKKLSHSTHRFVTS